MSFLRGRWSSQDMQKALQAVQGGASIRSTAVQFAIPRGTLQDRLKSGDFNHHEGRNAFFTAQEEAELCAYIKRMEMMFYGMSRDDVLRMAYDFAHANRKAPPRWEEKKKASLKWFRGFRKRQPELVLRKPEATSVHRVKALNREAVDTFYTNLQTILQQHPSLTADRIWNMDETGVTSVHCPGKILCERGRRQVGKMTSGERGQLVTNIVAMSATGQFLPPMLIYKRKKRVPGLGNGAPPGTLIEVSDSGWTSQDHFVRWLDLFIRQSGSTPERSVLLILDNHSSHISLDAYKVCKENGVIMLSLPPHTSHKLQPLDVSFMRAYKGNYNRACEDFMVNNPGRRILQTDIASLVGKAFPRTCKMEIAIGGFRACGIVPFDRDVLPEEIFAAASALNQDPQNVEKDDNFEGSSPTPTAGSSHLSPEDVRPLPVPAGREKGGQSRKRKAQSSKILTSTPMKDLLEAASAKRKHSNDDTLCGTRKKGKGRGQRKLFDISDEEDDVEVLNQYEENVAERTSDEDDFDEEEEESELQIEFENVTILPAVGQFILVELKDVRNATHLYVAKVIGEEHGDILVHFLRRNQKSAGHVFLFPPNPQQFSVPLTDIRKVLPAPMEASTARLKDRIQFDIDFGDLKLE